MSDIPRVILTIGYGDKELDCKLETIRITANDGSPRVGDITQFSMFHYQLVR